jgi:hypothetical protein
MPVYTPTAANIVLAAHRQREAVSTTASAEENSLCSAHDVSQNRQVIATRWDGTRHTMQHSNAKLIWRLREKDTRGMGGWGARTAVLFYSSTVTTAGVAVDVLTLSVKT